MNAPSVGRIANGHGPVSYGDSVGPAEAWSIDREMTEISDNEMGTLENAINNLFVAITPVLSVNSLKAGQTIREPALSSPLASRVCNLRDRIRALTMEVQNVTGAVEL